MERKKTLVRVITENVISRGYNILILIYFIGFIVADFIFLLWVLYIGFLTVLKTFMFLVYVLLSFIPFIPNIEGNPTKRSYTVFLIITNTLVFNDWINISFNQELSFGAFSIGSFSFISVIEVILTFSVSNLYSIGCCTAYIFSFYGLVPIFFGSLPNFTIYLQNASKDIQTISLFAEVCNAINLNEICVD